MSFALLAGGAVCGSQSSGKTSQELAQKLTDSFEFQNGKVVSGEKPLEHKSDPSYPQVTALDAPAAIKTGDSFILALQTNFAAHADITGAAVAIENNGAYAGKYIDVTAQVVVLDGKKTMTLSGKLGSNFGSDAGNFVVKIGMHKADGQVGNYYEWKLAVNGGADGGSGSGATQTIDITNPTTAQKTDAQDMAKGILDFGNNLKTIDTGFDQPLSMIDPLFNDTFDLAGSLLQYYYGGGGTPPAKSAALGLTADCGTKSGNTITYSCSEGTYTAVGTITINGDELVINVQVGYNDGASTVQTIDFNGTVKVTTTSVDGYVSFTATTTSGGTSTKFGVKNTYSNIAFDASKCPISGSESGDIIVNETNGQATGFLFKFDVTFGPSCGGMKMKMTVNTGY
jgi:hypothetical protein